MGNEGLTISKSEKNHAKEKNTKSKVEIDEIDTKILSLLTKDARTRLKDIAEECGISSVLALNRIKRLKKLGVIIGATLFPSLEPLGFKIIATIGIETDSNEDEILKFIGEETDLIEPSASIGKYDLCALVFAENIANLNRMVNEVRKRFGVRKVTIMVWSGKPYNLFENVDLHPREEDGNGQA